MQFMLIANLAPSVLESGHPRATETGRRLIEESASLDHIADLRGLGRGDVAATLPTAFQDDSGEAEEKCGHQAKSNLAETDATLADCNSRRYARKGHGIDRNSLPQAKVHS
jgi:hypothetical protein